jgi:NAD(P)-dependent dehydrogenase (short-subunit alcohol dehydrogenase family)
VEPLILFLCLQYYSAKSVSNQKSMETKIGLVTGGSRGLGKDMALAMARKGIDIVLTYNANVEQAEQVKAEIEEIPGRKAAVLQFDISRMENLTPFLENLKSTLQSIWGTSKFDFLIHNAGIGATLPIADVTEEKFDNLLNIHYKGVYFLTQKCIPLLNDNGGIIFISTGTTRFANPGYSVYASLKGAIEVLTKYVAKELGSRGIRANVVAPGPIETDFNNATIRNNPEFKSRLSGITALGRVGVAEDVGGVVAFLCTPESRWINGQRIEVSGGINL